MKHYQTEFKTSSELIAYPNSMDFMEARVHDIINGEKSDLVWLLEHPPLYTAGTSAKNADLLDANKFPVFDAGRGGEHTYHGPGQRIAYVMLNLKERHNNKPDLKKYVSQLEQWIINSLARLSVKGEKREGRVGIWVCNKQKEEKIAAIGIRVRKWVTFHGISLNINPDLSHFSGIVPCGLKEYGITSLEKLGVKVTGKEIDEILEQEFQKIFD